MSKFGFRPADILMVRKPSTKTLGGVKSKGLRLADILSISYSEVKDQWKIVFNTTYSKTAKEKGPR